MSDTSYVTQSKLTRSKPSAVDKPKKKSLRIWLLWSVTIFLWAGILYGSYGLAEHYVVSLQSQLADIEKSTAELHQTIEQLQTVLAQHKEQTAQLQEQFNRVESELETVKEEILLAEGSLEEVDETKLTLSERITELSVELNNLQNSIKKLEETTRVF